MKHPLQEMMGKCRQGIRCGTQHDEEAVVFPFLLVRDIEGAVK